MPNLHRLLAPALALWCSGCATTGPIDSIDGTSELRLMTPAPYRVAIAPIELSVQGARDLAATDSIRFAFSATAMHAQIVENLRALHTATEVFDIAAPGSTDPAAGEPVDADLLVRPRLLGVRLAHLGGNRNGLLSSLLWVTTWIGGLFVADNDYQVALHVEWELVNPRDGATLGILTSRAADRALAFFDRNPGLSFGTLQSVLVPPVFTSDAGEHVADTLSRAAIADVSARLARHLKTGMDGDERHTCGELRIDSPANGSVQTEASTFLRGRLTARAPIEGLAVFVGPRRVVVLGSADLPSLAAQEMGELYQIALQDLELPLDLGPNTIRLALRIGGHDTTRTLIVTRAPRAL